MLKASGARSGWYVYGNILFINTSEDPVAYSSGDGAFSIFSLTSLSNSIFSNNTISSLSSSGSCMFFPWTPVTTSNVLIENNLWYNCPQNNSPALNTGVTWDYNAYYGTSYSGCLSNCMYANDTSAHKSGAASDPFVNVAQTTNANNFNLTGNTTAGTSLSSNPPGCTTNVNCIGTDMNGVTGTDRGALNYSSGAAPPPASLGFLMAGLR